MNNKKVYISGAITGWKRETYMARFQKAEELLTDYGYKPVNPTNFFICKHLWAYKLIGYILALLYDLWQLSKCEYIYVIPFSSNSHGVNIEQNFAENLNIETLPHEIKSKIDSVFYAHWIYAAK